MTKEELKQKLEKVYKQERLIVNTAVNPIIELDTDLYSIVEDNKKFFQVKEIVHILRYKELPVFECETNDTVLRIINSVKY